MSLLKNALLSVFVGKSGREALKAYEESRKLDQVVPAERRREPSEVQGQATGPVVPTDMARSRPSLMSQAGGSDLDRALHKANVNMARKATKAVQAADNTDRQSLISEALQAHRSKQQFINDLDDETRVKLTMMALSAFMGGDKR